MPTPSAMGSCLCGGHTYLNQHLPLVWQGTSLSFLASESIALIFLNFILSCVYYYIGLQAQHISAGMHGAKRAHVPAQYPRHQAAVLALCNGAVFQRGHRGRRPREQHSPHSLHHPHCSLCPQHVCIWDRDAQNHFKLTSSTVFAVV